MKGSECPAKKFLIFRHLKKLFFCYHNILLDQYIAESLLFLFFSINL